MGQKKIKITDTTLRDGHQSLWATRMRTEEMIPILEKLDQVGYHSLEVWGGATFDVCMRYLNEDPWERLRTIKKYVKKTPVQMLLRGQSLLGYQHYPDDVVERFVAKTVENGMDIIRIFDALNDIRNLEVPMKVAKREGAHVQAALSFTVSPVHTMENFLETAEKLAELGADSICIKDMAGLLAPYTAYELVTLMKKRVDVPIQLHSHYIGGMALGAYLKAADAGVDIVDTASVPLAFGASQPPVETLVRALKDTPHDTGLDIHLLFEIADYFEALRKKDGYERGVTRISDMRVFEHQVPGGMISNLVSQLEEQKALNRMSEVLAEIPKVREELGYPPLVTPTSQIVGTQAVLNVLCGQRYKLVPGEVKAYVQGYYGKAPAPLDKDVAEKILKGEKVIDCRPADLLEPKMDKLKAEIQDLATSEEDVLSYALFPQVAKKYFEYRILEREEEEQNIVNTTATNTKTKTLSKQVINGTKEAIKMNLNEIKELIKMLDETEITELNLESEGVKVSIRKGGTMAIPANAQAAPANISSPRTAPVREEASTSPVVEKVAVRPENIVEVVSPMVGTFYRSPSPDAESFVELGSSIEEGEVVCIVEAMKLMNDIEAEVTGKIVEILVENGQPVEYGQPLFLVQKK